MKSLAAIITSAGWFIACSACAESGAYPSEDGIVSSTREEGRRWNLASDNLFDSAPYSFLPLDADWLDSSLRSHRTFSVGYRWRDLKLEGAATSTSLARTQGGRESVSSESFRLDSKSTRLLFNPLSDWTFQLSRNSLSGLDPVMLSSDARRTAIAAIYHPAASDGNWKTTLAWGRSTSKFRRAINGYLLESIYRFNSAHTVFGRLEQVGSDELLRENESQRGRHFSMNKLTLGYFQDVRISTPLQVEMGGLVSKHFIPSFATPSYGAAPVTYMMYIRMKTQ